MGKIDDIKAIIDSGIRQKFEADSISPVDVADTLDLISDALYENANLSESILDPEDPVVVIPDGTKRVLLDFPTAPETEVVLIMPPNPVDGDEIMVFPGAVPIITQLFVIATLPHKMFKVFNYRNFTLTPGPSPEVWASPYSAEWSIEYNTNGGEIPTPTNLGPEAVSAISVQCTNKSGGGSVNRSVIPDSTDAANFMTLLANLIAGILTEPEVDGGGGYEPADFEISAVGETLTLAWADPIVMDVTFELINNPQDFGLTVVKKFVYLEASLTWFQL